MALKFQYNKTALQQLKKGLKVRENALPTLQAKESALRLEVKNAKKDVTKAEEIYKSQKKKLETIYRLWTEFPGELIQIKDVTLDKKKIAGVNTPIFKDISFTEKRFSMISLPPWIPSGISLLKKAVEMQIRIEVARKKVSILEFARKKTTQKVNLYEKVQIPEYQSAILKIKRFMEDEENLAKSSQKILKERLAKMEAYA